MFWNSNSINNNKVIVLMALVACQHWVEAPEHRSEKPESTESPV